MLFSSHTYIIFFSIFFIFYWFVFKKSYFLQNIILLCGSYVFYGWADWRLLSYLIGASALNYFLGIAIANNGKYRRLFVYLGLLQGLSGLLFFKYYNFFISSFVDAFNTMGLNINFQTLNIIVPLGISYFTFKTVSYILDVKNEKIDATKDLFVFFNYISFFPTILSGPIDNGRSFIPQLQKKRKISSSGISDGLRQILLGVFKKLVIADNIAIITNDIFANNLELPASTLTLGAILFVIQMYADFSGYSDMAIGFGRLLGFNVTKNFAFPLYAQNIAEFWRKWHISLTAWLTEYIFTPLSIHLRNMGKYGLVIAIIINFTLCGLWHGPKWTFVLFGFIHGVCFIPLIINGKMNKRKKNSKSYLPSGREVLNIISTLLILIFTFILFNSENIDQAFNYISRMFSVSIITMPDLNKFPNAGFTILISFSFYISEWFVKDKEHSLSGLANSSAIVRWGIYYLLIFGIICFGVFKQSQFIYFQF